MFSNLLFLPLIIQIFLTIYLYILLAKAKTKAVKSGEVDERRRSLYEDAWPESVIKINNSIRSQFEIPILFYILIFIIWAIQAVNLVVHILAWSFVISRCIHAAVHTGSNYVPLRRRVFSIGVLIIGLLAFYASFYLFQY